MPYIPLGQFANVAPRPVWTDLGQSRGGYLHAQEIVLAGGTKGIIRSQNYVSGASGWAIFGDGSAEFFNVTVYGDIIASVWDGANPANLTSPDLTATAGFYLDSSAGAAQFQGDLFIGGNIQLHGDGNIDGNGKGNTEVPIDGALHVYQQDSSTAAYLQLGKGDTVAPIEEAMLWGYSNATNGWQLRMMNGTFGSQFIRQEWWITDIGTGQGGDWKVYNDAAEDILFWDDSGDEWFAYKQWTFDSLVRLTADPAVIFGAAGSEQMQFDEGVDYWAWAIGNDANAFTDRIRIYTSDHGSRASDIFFYRGDGSTAAGKWDESSAAWLWYEDMRPGTDVAFSLGNSTLSWLDLFVDNVKDRAGTLVYDVQNATFPTAQRFTADPAVIFGGAGGPQLQWDEATNGFFFKTGNIANVFTTRMVWRTSDHATAAHDMVIMDGDGVTTRMLYDDSAEKFQWTAEMAFVRDLTFTSDATVNIGDATNSALGGYFYNLYDEAGTLRWDLSGNMTMAGTINSLAIAPVADNTYDLGGAFGAAAFQDIRGYNVRTENIYDSAGTLVFDMNGDWVPQGDIAKAAGDLTISTPGILDFQSTSSGDIRIQDTLQTRTIRPNADLVRHIGGSGLAYGKLFVQNIYSEDDKIALDTSSPLTTLPIANNGMGRSTSSTTPGADPTWVTVVSVTVTLDYSGQEVIVTADGISHCTNLDEGESFDAQILIDGNAAGLVTTHKRGTISANQSGHTHTIAGDGGHDHFGAVGAEGNHDHSSPTGSTDPAITVAVGDDEVALPVMGYYALTGASAPSGSTFVIAMQVRESGGASAFNHEMKWEVKRV